MAAGRFSMMVRKQYKLCTAAPSAAVYHMISAANWRILTLGTAPCLFDLEIPTDFPQVAAKITPLTMQLEPICTDGATNIESVVGLAASAAGAGTVDAAMFEIFLPQLAELAASLAEYSAAWVDIAEMQRIKSQLDSIIAAATVKN